MDTSCVWSFPRFFKKIISRAFATDQPSGTIVDMPSPSDRFYFFLFFPKREIRISGAVLLWSLYREWKKSEISKFLSNFFFFMLFNGESIEQDVSGFFFLFFINWNILWIVKKNGPVRLLYWWRMSYGHFAFTCQRYARVLSPTSPRWDLECIIKPLTFSLCFVAGKQGQACRIS